MRRLLYFCTVVMGAVFVLIALSNQPTAAQEDGEEAEYTGARRCTGCHRDIASAHEATGHGMALLEADNNEEAILADFESGEDIRTITFPDGETRPLTTEDIAYVMGKGRYVQRYVFEVDGGEYRVLPVEWNTVNQEWLPYQLGEEGWLNNPAHDWGTQCAYCHTTGFESGDSGVSWEDDGVQCEACHGPGSIHARERTPESIVLSPDPQICGQCHSQARQAETEHPFPAHYIPGQELLNEEYALIPQDADEYWWTEVHGSGSNMQYNEWRISAHATVPSDVLGDIERADTSCLQCHSGDYLWTQDLIALHESGERSGDPPEAITIETAQYGPTCTTCHELHQEAESPEDVVDLMLKAEPYDLCVQCHTDNDLTDGIHYPVQQMFEGTTFIDQVDSMPSAHFSTENGPECITCHMQRVPIGSFTLASHALDPVLPEMALDEDRLEDSCSSCHGEQANPVAMQALIDDTQSGTAARLEAIQAALTGDEPEWVSLAVDFIASDDSVGIHNYAYTDALLDAIEAEMQLNQEGQ